MKYNPCEKCDLKPTDSKENITCNICSFSKLKKKYKNLSNKYKEQIKLAEKIIPKEWLYLDGTIKDLEEKIDL